MGTANNLNRDSLHLMDSAIELLCQQGFIFVDLPWVVQRQYSDATRPPTAQDFETPMGSLVASGEQSFLQMWVRGELPPMQKGALGYVGWTPCFRDEPVLDQLHQTMFLKVEWFVPETFSRSPDLPKLMEIQMGVFRNLATHYLSTSYREVKNALTIVKMDNGSYDINACGIEIGSYGRRGFDSHSYAYGTGLALPRFTTALASMVKK